MSSRANACPSTVLLVERVLPSVFPLSVGDLHAMRQVVGLHDTARRKLADVALPAELRPLLDAEEANLHRAVRAAVEQEAPALDYMAPDQIVWHVLTAAARLLG